MRFLSPDEVTDLANAIDPRYHALVVTAAYTGLRWGELAALQLGNLNLLRRSITVTHTLTEVEGRIHRGEPKTPASRRQVALSPTIADLIGRHIGVYPDPDGFVFSSPDGLPLRGPNFRRRHWVPAVQASVGQPCRFHDVRHSHVALLIAQGEHPKTIAGRLGHTSVRTVLDVYGHLFEGLDGAAADRLNRIAAQIAAQHLAASPLPGIR